MPPPKDPRKRAEWIKKLRKANIGKPHPSMTGENHPMYGKHYFQKEIQNTPEMLALIQSYGNPLIKGLREKYYTLNGRCSNPNHPDYKWYGGRGIQNRFTSQLDFLDYVIFELHITKFSQIDGLQIDRIDNDGNYEPGNIRFVGQQVNLNNKHKKYNKKK